MASTNTQPYETRIIRRSGETWPRAGNPPGWAQHRLEMIDALPWFKSAQGGVHLTSVSDPGGLFVLGMLIGGFAGERSYVDAEVVITCLNGSQGNTPNTPDTDRRQNAMRNNIATGRLVGIIFESGSTNERGITGNRRGRDAASQVFPCSNMPTTGGHRQNCWVGDWFLPTLLWPMKLRDRTGSVWMVRLEKYNLQNQSWWANLMHGLPPADHSRDFSIFTPHELCTVCQQASPRIFEEMFICLQHACAAVWMHNGQIVSDTETLTYTDTFLQERRARPLSQIHFPTGDPQLVRDFGNWWTIHYLGPMNRGEALTNQNFADRMRSLLQGFACPTCGMMNHRVRWHEWHCRNARCNGPNGTPFSIRGDPPTVSIQQAQTLGATGDRAPDFSHHRAYTRTRDLPDFTADEFTLGEGCHVAYLKPKPHTNQAPLGSDYFYTRIQQLAASGSIPLERRGMNTAAGHMLTAHFAANYGQTYIYGASVPTIAFQSADPVIQQSLDRVNDWVAPYRTPDDDLANEMYLAGYWTDQRMNWHTDGESFLGDVITTYTLGGQGTFRIRIHPRYHCGFTRARDGSIRGNAIDYDPVMPGCLEEARRTELRRQLDANEITQLQWQQQFDTLMRAAARGPNHTLLSLPVHHGYIVVMYGPNTQRYLEHCVDVTSPMRFALTYRSIGAGHVTPQLKNQLRSRLAYDVDFDPGDDWTIPAYLTPVNSRPATPSLAMPALSPRDNNTPIATRTRSRSRTNSVNPTQDQSSGALSGSTPGPSISQGSNRSSRGRPRGRAAGGRTRGASSNSAALPPPPSPPPPAAQNADVVMGGTGDGSVGGRRVRARRGN